MVHALVVPSFDTYLYQKKVLFSHSYVTGLSIIAGFYAFGFQVCPAGCLFI
jgi:hypothetical protein